MKIAVREVTKRFGAVAAVDAVSLEIVDGELFTLLVHPTVTTADLDDVVRAIGKVVNG